MRSIVGSLALVALMSSGAVAENAAPPVLPGDAEEIARQKATSAKRAFDRGDYDTAIADYREAYRLVPTSGLLYNLGQAYRLAGRCADAADAYRRYLAHSPDSPYRATAEQNLAASELCARDLGQRPTAPGLGDGSGAAADGARDWRRPTGAIVAGGGVVLLATGAYFALDAKRARDEVAAFYEEGGAWEDIGDVDARGRRSRTLSRVSLVAGVAAVATGGTLWWLGRRAERDHTIAVAPTGDGGEVRVSWRF